MTLAVEGDTDAAVAGRLLAEVGLHAGVVHGKRGKGYLDARLQGFNHAAQYAPWFVLRDLDRDADCAPPLVASLLPKPAEGMVFRVAVRAIEAWLLADRERMSLFLSVPLSSLPSRPDALDDPKMELLNLARRSKKRSIRLDLVPTPGTTGKVGQAYLTRLVEFVSTHWRPTAGARHSDSLARCLGALDRWAKTV